MELAEALAARRAVVFAKELSLFNVKIDGDCSQTIKVLTDLRRCNTLFGHVIDESLSLGTTLQYCKFPNVRMKGNRLAHTLARKIVFIYRHRCMDGISTQ
ncbi:hypothetical protein SO802_003957 [Lithocarpus litseifolius]|uniref:RNase H type-1 domain-containing protein n=1 Tax=Lithocarpus litseifolius TaxID=425828 RepID=A0AAW2E544_9ROSI